MGSQFSKDERSFPFFSIFFHQFNQLNVFESCSFSIFGVMLSFMKLMYLAAFIDFIASLQSILVTSIGPFQLRPLGRTLLKSRPSKSSLSA